MLSVIGEGLFQIVLELLVEFGWRAAGEPFERERRAHPVVAGVSLVLVGGAFGGLLWLLVPTRVLPAGIPGASLVLSPVLTGTAMEYYGRWREGRGAQRSFAATFWGGALFALGMAAARFILLKR